MAARGRAPAVRRALFAGVLALVAACAEPTPPSRGGTYRFDLNGEVFHWPSDRLPVRFYVVSQGNLPLLVQRAVDAWAGLFLYNEFTGALVGDSTAADVIVAWNGAVPPDATPDTGAPVPACQGLTNLPAVDSTTNRFGGPFHVYLGWLSGYTPGQVQACLRRVAIHEVGHTLGLLPESPDPGDIMYVDPRVDLPSEQDRRTVEVLYHTRPTVLPPP